MPYAYFSGKKTYYEFTPGKKETIVFVHGWNINYTEWIRLSKILLAEGYGVLLYNLYGYGTSSSLKKVSSYSLLKYKNQLKNLLNHLKIKNPVLVGHSMGGMISLKYAGVENVKALILIASTYRDPFNIFDSKHLFREKIMNFLTNIKNAEVRRNVESFDFSKDWDHNDFYFFLKGITHTKDTTLLGGLHALMNNNQKNILAKLKMPVLIIVGKKDFTTPVEESVYMHKKIKNSELRIMSGGHDLNIARYKEVSKEIIEFLKKL